jgi:hypothetical protein
MLERMAQSGMLNLFEKADKAVAKVSEQTDGVETPGKPALEASSQSDLTSPPSQLQTKSDSLEEMPIESDKKKT